MERATASLPVAAVAAPVPGRVVVGAGLLALGAMPLLFVLPHDRVAVDASLPLLAWLPVGIAGVVALDRRRGSALGWAAVASSTSPAVVVALDAGPGPGWLLPLLLVALVGAWERRTGDRAVRRWGVWLVVWPVATVVVGWVAWSTAGDTTYGAVATTGMLVVAGTVAASGSSAPRPVDEPLLDLGLVVGVLTLGLAVWAAVGWFASHERIFAGEVVAVFAGAVSVVLAAPGAAWARREVLARRYGPGVLDPDAVATLTADLGSEGDPRALLAKASSMVAATSGAAEATITLADPTDEAAATTSAADWFSVPLVVGEEAVGTLGVRSRSPDGLEVRQERVVTQLAPTVALVARAVVLAVEARHARSDLARERDAERARILADLHDDLGPVLAGMSMRVQAAQRLNPSPELADLATDLAAARSDLRRIVGGLTPAALADPEAGVTPAIVRLVESFHTDGGPSLGLLGGVPDGLPVPHAVVVYRTIAEAVANAVRHADADVISVEIVADDRQVVLNVVDDGRGGAVVPGVGLSSLRARAEELHGALEVGPGEGRGTCVRLMLPRSPA